MKSPLDYAHDVLRVAGHQRVSCIAVPGYGPLFGTFGWPIEDLKVLLSDRAANGESFPQEFIVRLPRNYYRRQRVWQLAQTVA